MNSSNQIVADMNNKKNKQSDLQHALINCNTQNHWYEKNHNNTINIDGEKNKSLVISMTNSSKSPWFGSEFKILKFNGSHWNDATSSYFLESKIIDVEAREVLKHESNSDA